jgi:anionic cell wall polymer biosynthesis LytR-Cps2A-Psr (LCP) family protein
VAGRRWDTIGATYEDGGVKLTVRTLEKMFGTQLDHSAVANQEGFLALSQQVGPINVNNPKAFTSVGITFKQGRITLSQVQVLAYVRASGTDAPGDQVNRQQLVIEAGIRKQLSGDLLSSPEKLAAFISAASDHLTLDKALTPTRLATIAFSLDITESDVAVIRVPLSSKVTTVHGLPVQKVDPVLFPELADALKRDRLASYIAAHPKP